MAEPDSLFRPALTLTGHVEATLVCDQPAGSTPRPNIELQFDGIVDDRHFGRTRKLGPRDKALKVVGHPKGALLAPTRQVSIVSVEELRKIEARLSLGGPIPPGALGENLVISGIPSLTRLPSGTLLCFKRGDELRDAVIWTCEENTPCVIAGRALEETMGVTGIAAPFVDAAMGLRGIVGFVHREGSIEAGDTVLALVPAQHLYSP